MKTRNGYVSNSSSSSFIVAYNYLEEECKCPHCDSVSMSPREFISSLERIINANCTTFTKEEFIKTAQENIKEFNKNIEFYKIKNSMKEYGSEYALSREEDAKRSTETLMKEVEEIDRDTIAEFEISYYDYMPICILKQLIKQGKLVLIRGEEL